MELRDLPAHLIQKLKNCVGGIYYQTEIELQMTIDSAMLTFEVFCGGTYVARPQKTFSYSSFSQMAELQMKF